jgi:hypothetical protein
MSTFDRYAAGTRGALDRTVEPVGDHESSVV